MEFQVFQKFVWRPKRTYRNVAAEKEILSIVTTSILLYYIFLCNSMKPRKPTGINS